ncbi:hypothetical protein [Flagellimonas sp.]|uniref:hypothetical protein n=1 Tax=Flagellimonas sp. TaxID=2058762 RepID=UPI003B5CFB59
MKNCAFLLIPLVFLTSCADKKVVNGLTPYQNLSMVSDFAPELSVKGNTFKGSFSDDFNTFYFFRKVDPETEKYIPYVSHYLDGKWTDPKVISYFDKDNSYTYQLKIPGKEQLVFISDKKMEKDTAQNKSSNYNFWSTKILEAGFSEPEAFGYENLIYNYNSQPCVSEDGTIYFTSDASDWSATYSYKMEAISEGYATPELFQPVNNWRKNQDWDVFEFAMSPKADYMIICIQDKTQDIVSTDLFISHLKDGNWTYPKKLNADINSSETENFPTITQDGSYLIFTRAFSEFKIVPTSQFMDK